MESDVGCGTRDTGLVVRSARLEDAAAIARIYNQGIEERIATFETEPRSVENMTAWLREKEGRYPVIVAEREGRVMAWAGVGSYRPRPCYDSVAEFSIYADREARGTGAAQAALQGLIDACERAGFTKLVSRIFPENVRSRGLCRKVGFREVGTYQRHGKLDGVWRDTVIVERLLGEALEGLDDQPTG
jgi:L-amino acid N-acyltransferase YncA